MKFTIIFKLHKKMEINFDLYKPAEGHILILKSLPADMVAARAHVSGGFKWPESGECTAPDWSEAPWCGNGLHGWKWGVGDSTLRVTDDDAKWLILSVAENSIVDLEGKVKFPTCQILYLGDRETAVKIIQNFAPNGTPIMFATVTGGDGATVTGGDGATVTGGYRATVTGGDGATVTGGYRATVTGGDGATVTGGYRATVTGGNDATVTGGDGATVTGGDGATVTGGDGATVTGGYRATVTGGDGATVTGGDVATVTGGAVATVTGGDGATVTGGDGATVTGGDRATVTGGNRATVTGGNDATVTGGDGALLVFRYWIWIDSKYTFQRKMALVDGVNYLPGVKYRIIDGEIKPVSDQNEGE